MVFGKKYGTLLVILISFFFASCSDDPGGNDPDEKGEYFQVDSWMRSNMEYYYFWNELVPESTDGTIQPEPYFESMLQSDDIFSYMSDDYETLLDDLNGSSFSAGYSPAFGRFSNSDRVFIMVEFVYDGTPADEAGLERGDIIMKINGQEMNIENYLDLYYEETDAIYTLGAYNSEVNSISETNETVTVAKAQLELDPVVHTEIFEKEGTKIGYFFYARFTNGENNKFIESVNQALADFQAEGVSELIVDLRYNPGGSINSSVNIANSLAPQSAVNNEEVFVSFKYNSGLQQDFETNEGPNSPNLFVHFSEDPVNLSLDRVFFLTTSSSASASELLINGLSPYMDVVSIGTPTFGKFYGSFVLTGENASPPNSYAIVPVVLKYANALGVTDFRDGLAPDYEVNESILGGVPIGDPSDPLLSKALELITGDVPAKIAEPLRFPFEKLDNPVELKKGNVLRVLEK